MKPSTKKTVLTLAALLTASLFVSIELRADTFLISDLTEGNVVITHTGTSTVLTVTGVAPEAITFFITGLFKTVVSPLVDTTAGLVEVGVDPLTGEATDEL